MRWKKDNLQIFTFQKMFYYYSLRLFLSGILKTNCLDVCAYSGDGGRSN